MARFTAYGVGVAVAGLVLAVAALGSLGAPVPAQEFPAQEVGRINSGAAVLNPSAPMTSTPTVPATADPAYFEVGFSSLPTVTFVIKLVHADTIADARGYLANNQQISVMGLIEKEPADYNPGWSYHLVPETISFFEFATEVCDANPIYLEQHLDEACGAFLPDCRWCPWSSYLKQELSAPLSESILLPVALNQTAQEPTPRPPAVTPMPGTPTVGPTPPIRVTRPACPPPPACTPGPPPPTDTPCPPGVVCREPCQPCQP